MSSESKTYILSYGSPVSNNYEPNSMPCMAAHDAFVESKANFERQPWQADNSNPRWNTIKSFQSSEGKKLTAVPSAPSNKPK